MSYKIILSSLLLCNLSVQVASFSTSNAPSRISISRSEPNASHSHSHSHTRSHSPQPRHSTQLAQQNAPTANTNVAIKPSPRSQSWLDQATIEILDLSRTKIGQLTADDVESISGLMANWAKRKSTYSAIQVETLLKRVVDDHNAGNDTVNVSTRMYTMAIDAWAKTGGKQAAERASEIHKGMVDAYRSTGDLNVKPSTISYNAVINAWSKSGCDAEAAIRAEGILQEMLEEWRKERNNIPHDVVDVDLKSDDGIDDDGDDCDNNAVNKEDPDEIPRLDSPIVKPDVVSFTSVIDAWAKSGSKDGAAKAMNLLKQMEKLYVEEGQRGMKPNVYTYSACINAFAKSTDLEAPKRAEALLADMKEAYEAGDMDVKPNVVNYNSVLNAWGRCKKHGSAQRASQILHSMKDEGVEPDALSYSLVVSAWAHSANADATKQAEFALKEMENWAKEKNKAIDEAFDNGLSDHASSNGQLDADTPSSLPAIRVHLDVECYNTVLIALSRRREDDASDRAIAILNHMQHLANNGFETVRPNAKSWNSVLNTLSRARSEDAAERAEQLLNEMYEVGKQPDVFSYAALLHAYQKNSSPRGAVRADNIVRQMEQLYFDGILSDSPDVYHYTIVCACWARSGQSIAAQRCWEILQHMERRVEQGFLNCKPNVRTYNAVIDAYARGHHVDEAEKLLDEMLQRYYAGDKKVRPDGFTFNAVINAWTRSRRKGCGTRAEMILRRLLEFHEDGNPDVKPDSRSFSHIIDYYSRSREKDAGMRSEWLLLGMLKMYENGYRNVLPTIFTFAAVISTYAKTKHLEAGVNAERILRLLEDFHRKNNVPALAPNTFIMNTVLHAWSKSGNSMAGQRVDDILTYMEREYNEGNFALQPNTRSYGLALASWAKSSCPEKAKHAGNILNRMKDASETNESVTMNVHCYNAVMNAAAFTEANVNVRKEAFFIATNTMKELLASTTVEAISSSFGTYLKACGKLSLPREMVEPEIKRAFIQCKELGLVNDFVLTQVRYSTCSSQYQTLLGKIVNNKKINEKVSMAEVPKHWKRNVAVPFLDDADRGEWWRND